MTKRKLKISAIGTVERNTVDVAEAVKTILAAKPDAVVMISAYKSCAEFIRQMKKAGSAAQFFNVSFVGSKALADSLGKEGVGVAISQVVPFPWAPSVPMVKEYQQLLKGRAKGLELHHARGLPRREGSGRGPAPRRQGPHARAIHRRDGEHEDVDLGGFLVSFSPKNHNGSNFVDLTIIGRDGKFLR